MATYADMHNYTITAGNEFVQALLAHLEDHEKVSDEFVRQMYEQYATAKSDMHVCYPFRQDMFPPTFAHSVLMLWQFFVTAAVIDDPDMTKGPIIAAAKAHLDRHQVV